MACPGNRAEVEPDIETVRFFMLQSHYSSTLDISNEALKAAQKGYKKIANGIKLANTLEYIDLHSVCIMSQ